jgi:MFS transporter, DHA2 family, multidrug resistance protein
VNQVARQVGGALGVAIVGSVFAAVYVAEISEDSRVPAVATESIEDATDVANRLHGAARADLLNDAVASFDVAARWGLAVCMAVLLLGAVSAAVRLSRASPAE